MIIRRRSVITRKVNVMNIAVTEEQIKKWELDQDTKGDIIFKYTKSQIQVLRRKGLLDNLDEFRNF